MKRFLLSFALLVAATASLHAMSFRKARQYAYFLTDKMAYELNLTEEQYERAYEVNLDYFLSVDSPHDIYGNYWHFRDSDLRYILFDWQYALYRVADYFYRPVVWLHNSFAFSIYDRYRHADYYYYDRPRIYREYRGSNWARRSYNAYSPYRGMVFSGRHGGMREQYVPMQGYGYHYGNGYRYHENNNYRHFYGQQYNNGHYHFDRSNGNRYSNNGNRYGRDNSQHYDNGRQGYRNEPTRGGNFGQGQRYDNGQQHYDNSNFRYDNGGQRYDNSRSNNSFTPQSQSIVRGNRGNAPSRGGSFSQPTQPQRSQPQMNAPARGNFESRSNTQDGSTRTQNGYTIVGGRR